MGEDGRHGAVIQDRRGAQPTAADATHGGTGLGETSPDDAALVSRTRHDPRAFAPLYDRYFEPVYRYCHRRLGDHDQATKATAQLYSRALAALPRYAATDAQANRRAG